MDRTQYLVSVNGKTGERVRRTEAYIGGISNDAMIPLWSATVGGGGITKCGTGASQSSSSSTCGTLSEAEVNRTYRNVTDYVICKHEYYTHTTDDYGQAVAVPEEYELAECSK